MAFRNSPISEAAHLDEIGFPEFTAKLITDTFDALVSANMRQTESYIELIQSVSKTLTEFINETSDDISGEELLQFLGMVVPEAEKKVKVGQSLSSDDAAALNAAVRLPVAAAPHNQADVADTAQIDQSKFDAILDAVAHRISASRYDLLKEMVKQGMLRLVVEDGLIETRLTFRAYAATYYQNVSTSYQRKTYENRSRGGTGRIISLFGSYASATKRTALGIRTTKETQQDTSGSSVSIFGMVRIKFKTDYLPLNA